MAETFKMPSNAKQAFPTMSDAIEEAAFKAAADFRELGLGPREATSAVAHAMVRAAWTVAGCGRITAGGQPDPEAFLAVAKDATNKITWPSDDESCADAE